MLKAKLNSARKNKKGFSLVELIIVMAIMVALVAVMAPQFIKYVQRSRDSVVSDAAENMLSCVKTEIALGHIDYNRTADTDEAIIIKTDDAGNLKASDGSIKKGTGMKFGTADIANCGADYSNFAGFVYDFCGVDSDKATKTKVEYKISISSAGVATLTQTKDANGTAIN